MPCPPTQCWKTRVVRKVEKPWTSLRVFRFPDCVIPLDRLVNQRKNPASQTLAAHWTTLLGSFLLEPVQDAVLVIHQQPAERQGLEIVPYGKRVCSRPALEMLGRIVKREAWYVLKGQPSPGYLHFAQVASKGLRQMPHMSSPLGTFHFHFATMSSFLILTFMMKRWRLGVL